MSTAHGQRIKCMMCAVKEDLLQETRRQRWTGGVANTRQKDRHVLGHSAGKRLE